MKRSKAIELLDSEILKLKTMDEITGHRILEFVESLGMLPPAKSGVVKVEEAGDSLVIPVWGWEDET